MTLREVQALLLLYQAASEDAQRRALQLVPDLRDLVEDPQDDAIKTYNLILRNGQMKPIADRRVTCRRSDLDVEQRRMISDYPLVVIPIVTYQEIE